MSQRKFRDGRLEVLTGWDAPLRYHFLVIEDLDAPADDPRDGLVFSNLRLGYGGMTLEVIDAVLRGLGIRVPPTLLDDLRRDRAANDREGVHT